MNFPEKIGYFSYPKSYPHPRGGQRQAEAGSQSDVG